MRALVFLLALDFVRPVGHTVVLYFAMRVPGRYGGISIVVGGGCGVFARDHPPVFGSTLRFLGPPSVFWVSPFWTTLLGLRPAWFFARGVLAWAWQLHRLGNPWAWFLIGLATLGLATSRLGNLGLATPWAWRLRLGNLLGLAT